MPDATETAHPPSRAEEDSGARRPPTRRVPLRAAWAAVLLVITVALSLWHNPVSEALLAVLALAVPAIGYTLLVLRFVPGDPARAGAIGVATTLALWTLLEFALVGLFHETRPAAQAVLAVLILLPPMLWATLPPGTRRPTTEVLQQGVSAATLPVVGAGVGGLILALSQHMARDQTQPTAAFMVFWVGMAVIFVPLVVITLGRSGLPPVARLVLVGAASYLPTFIRSPLRVFNYDEFGHLGEAREIIFSGRLYQPDSTIPIGPKYPGFETLVVGVARLTGLPMVAAGQLCALLCHIGVVLAVGGFAMAVHSNARSALIAGMLYAVSPQFVQFDALFSYETVALVYFVAILMCSIAASRYARRSAERRALVTVTALLMLAMVITHHLSTILLALVLLAAAAFHLVQALYRSGKQRGAGVAFAGAGLLGAEGAGLLAAVALYSVVAHANLWDYLGAFPRSAWSGIKSYLGAGDDAVNISSAVTYEQRQSAGRSLFQGTALPLYERLVGIATQVLLLAISLYILVRVWHKLTPWLFTCFALAGAYFVSLPLSFIAVASSGAHRTWAFTFIGVALVVSTLQTREASAHREGANDASRRSRRARVPLIGALVLGVLMASYAISVNLYSRFQGPYVLGADGRDNTADVSRSAQWLLENEGHNRRIIAIRRNATVFSAIATTRLVSFPSWLVFYPTSQPPQNVIDGLRAAHVQFLVVDSRVSTSVPVQSYFSVNEPEPPIEPLDRRSVTKFASSPWLREVHHDDHITIYRLRRAD